MKNKIAIVDISDENLKGLLALKKHNPPEDIFIIVSAEGENILTDFMKEIAEFVPPKPLPLPTIKQATPILKDRGVIPDKYRPKHKRK